MLHPELRRALAGETEHEAAEALADKAQPFLMEVYTDTATVAREALRRGHVVAENLTLRTGWNFYLAADREACLNKVRETRPFLLILAFPCSVWSAIMCQPWSADSVNRIASWLNSQATSFG